MSSQEIDQEVVLYWNRDECPYFPGRERVTYFFAAPTLPPLPYETLISSGFRRSGYTFYQHHCPACQDCLPIRVDIRRLTLSTSQRRVLRKNRDVTILRHPNAFKPEDFLLYRAYCAQRHPSSPVPDEESYRDFLIASPLTTEIMRYYVQDRLVGLGWIDLLPHSLSSVYFSFDPEYSSRSLGTFSVLQQAALCARLGKEWLHLGFWVKERQNMAYKSRFKPCQILIDGTWRELDSTPNFPACLA